MRNKPVTNRQLLDVIRWAYGLDSDYKVMKLLDEHGMPVSMSSLAKFAKSEKHNTHNKLAALLIDIIDPEKQVTG